VTPEQRYRNNSNRCPLCGGSVARETIARYADGETEIRVTCDDCPLVIDERRTRVDFKIRTEPGA
jgi:hypothetical protein